MTTAQPRHPSHTPFSNGFLALIIFCLVTLVAAVTAFVLWTGARADDRSLERQTALVSHILEGELAQMADDQERLALWDETVLNARVAFNPEWLDDRVGHWMGHYFGHDMTFLLDADDQPVYGMVAGTSGAAGAYQRYAQSLGPRVESLRTELVRRGPTPDARVPVEQRALPGMTDIVDLHGMPAIVGIVPLRSDTGLIDQEPGSEYLMVSIALLDQGFADQLADLFMINAVSFRSGPTADDRAAYPVRDAAGRTITNFEWQPDRPGRSMLTETLPVLAAVCFIACIGIVMLLDRLLRSSADLENGRREAQHRALHDGLTGLPNRAHFEQHLDQQLAQRKRGSKSLALLLIDLDRFKQVNDTLGHPAGDELIQGVAHRLGILIGNDGFIARLGGDEFAIVSKETGKQASMALASRLIDALSQPFALADGEAFIGASIGVVLTSARQRTDRQELTRRADIALYEAKAAGRNRAVVFEERMDAALQRRHGIEADLRDALRGDSQIDVVFQPLFDMGGGSILGVEALVRWTHPDDGPMAPLDFVPIAESTGLIDELGELVLRRACELGARHKGRLMAVNISPAQLRNPKFAALLFEILAETGMRAEDLELEITESILLDEENTTNGTLRRFRNAGIRIALDDFGTGYSSLSYLSRYEVDRIKIDRTFIHQLEDLDTARAIVEAMVSLAHALDISVTAEGVETEEQKRLLTTMGCDSVQGRLLSPPLPAADVDSVLDAEATLPRPSRVA